MMHGLFVKAPFAGWIVDDVKMIEYRTRETLIRGRIGIIESGTGTVIGDAKLFDCVWSEEKKLWVWMLREARRYAKPVPFEHKRGCVTWAILDIDPDAQEIAPRLSAEEDRRETDRYREAQSTWLQKYARSHAKQEAKG